MTYADFERSKGQISLIETNIKNMFVTVKAMYLLVINLVSLLILTWVKMIFTILLLVWSKRANTVVM